jgi:hypothetical protein
MNEASIRDFFEGRLAPAQLDSAWASAFTVEPRSDGSIVRRLGSVEPLASPFQLVPDHVASLIDATMNGSLSLDALAAVCFAIEASDTFEWDADTHDGDRVAKGLFLLSSPEVNYPLTPSVLAKIRRYVLTGEDTFTNEDLRIRGDSRGASHSPEPKRGA